MNDDLASIYTSAAWAALAHFPVQAESIKLIDHSENLTFRVRVRDGSSGYTLRFHRPGYNSLTELESERAWVSALIDAGLPVPGPLLTRDGAHFVPMDIPRAKQKRYVGVTTWLEGAALRNCSEILADTRMRARVFHRIGEIVAAMHNQATRWQAPSGFTRPRLDLDGLLGDTPRWGRFWEYAELSDGARERLLASRERLRTALSDYGMTPDNFSLIHADLDPGNIIHDRGELALIDFDDSAYGWHMYDVASALMEYLSDPDFAALRAALLEGYREHRPLAQGDVEMLPDFLLLRGMATLGWYHDRPEHAGSAALQHLQSWILELCEARM
ncbi:MAG: phosphotransferase enzyme family protein [Gammaproteobacteria bacterium]